MVKDLIKSKKILKISDWKKEQNSKYGNNSKNRTLKHLCRNQADK